MTKETADQFLNLFFSGALDLDWPARHTTEWWTKQGKNSKEQIIEKILTKYKNEYDALNSSNIIAGNVLTCWDDWILDDGLWYKFAPFCLKNKYYKDLIREFIRLICLVKGNLTKEKVTTSLGVSEFLYKVIPVKKIFSFVITDNTFECSLEKNRILFHIPISQYIKTKQEYINHIEEAYSSTEDIEFLSRKELFDIGDELQIVDEIETINKENFLKVISEEKISTEINKILNYLQESVSFNINKIPDAYYNNFFYLLYNIWIFFSFLGQVIKEVHYIPSKGFVSEKISSTNQETFFHEECSGGIYIWCDKNTKVDLEALQAYQTYRGLRTSVVDFAKREEREVRELALKNAMSVIMSRNMSHNIGSHVMPRTEPSMVFRRLKEFYTDGPYIPADIFIYGMAGNVLARLHRHIQYKSDFLAEITTEPGTSTRKARFFMDVMANFLGNTLLLDNLAAMEGLGYEDKWCDCENLSPPSDKPSQYPETTLRVDCFFDGKAKFKPVFGFESRDGIRYENVYVPLGWRDIHAYGEDLTLTNLQENCPGDPIIALPGPLGEFALYGFLENFIRNAAKHNQELIKNNGNTLTIELKIKKDEKHPHDYYLLEITSDAYDTYENTQKLKKKLDDLLKSDLIDESNSPRATGWGIAEMMICANLLAGENELYRYHEGEQNDKEKPPPPLTIKAEKKQNNCKTKTGRIVYTLHLMKPKQAIFFGKFEKLKQGFPEKIKNIKDDTEWKEKGILVFNSLEEFAKEIRDGKIVASSFDFAILEEEQTDNLSDFLHLLPFRIVVVIPNGKTRLLEKSGGIYVAENEIDLEGEPDEFIKGIWERWLRTRWPDGASTLALYLGQSNHAFPSTLWANKCEKFSDHFSVLLANKDKERDSAQNSGKIILFDRHGQLLPGKKEQNNIASYIVFDKSSADFAQIFQPPASDPWLFPYELLEAGLLKVLVLDERIAENAMQLFADEKIAKFLTGQDDRQPLFWHLAYRANVLIATHVKYAADDGKSTLVVHDKSYKKQENLAKQTKSSNQSLQPCCPKLTLDISDKTKVLIDDCSEGKKGHLDMLIIHQGVLDRLHKTGAGTPEKLLKCFKKNIPWVIVESGRGIPPEIQKTKDKFLPFSAIDHCLNGIRVAKLSIAQRTMTLTRKKHNDDQK